MTDGGAELGRAEPSACKNTLPQSAHQHYNIDTTATTTCSGSCNPFKTRQTFSSMVCYNTGAPTCTALNLLTQGEQLSSTLLGSTVKRTDKTTPLDIRE